MTKQEFSKTIAGISYSMWRAVLAGKRNLGYKKATLVSQLLDTSSDIWQDKDHKNERVAAWEKYVSKK